MPKVTQSELMELLSYDAGTGVFTWLVDRGSNKVKGKPAGTDKEGYTNISINGRRYRAHSLAWLYVHGYIPVELDHVNRVKSDNMLSNLRLTDRAKNSQNRGLSISNTTGVTGVSRHKQSGKFVAQITVCRQVHYLGLHGTVESAAAARKQAEVNLNFGVNNA